MLQNRAFGNLFVGPNRIEDVAQSMQRIERGDVKLRVRALETERALNRVTVSLLPACTAACCIKGSAVLRVPGD